MKAFTNHSGSRNYVDIPVYLKGGDEEGDAMGRRQCTDNYKIRPIRRRIRELLGLKPRQRVPAGTTIELWLDISTDEAIRMKTSRDRWMTNRYPLIEAGMPRSDCLNWWKERYDRPLERSACVACPFQSRQRWVETKRRACPRPDRGWPELFAEAVEIDARLRDGLALDKTPYLHTMRMPLAEAVDLDEVGLGLAVGGWAWHRWKKARKRVEDPILIGEKVSRIAFDAELQIVAVVPAGTGPQRAGELLGKVAAAYRHFDNPAGARFKVGKVRPVLPNPEMLHPSGPGLFGGRSVLGVREAACLWHPPGAGDETPLVERSGARTLSPSAKGVRGGALVGDTTAGAKREIRFPDDLLRRHHLYVARTRMGKSTLMHHLVTHKLREKAEGRDPDAIVVIDPHTDLVVGILEHVPEPLIDRVRLIDLSDETRSPGINLLDNHVFADRDRTADSVVRVAKGLWEQWGPRMQSILEQTVKTLHEANEQVEAEAQYTILDGLKLLSDDPFRKDVLKKVSDPYLLEWWARDFGRWHTQYKAEALAPVQTRLSYYASSKRARAILGQRRSTIDLRRTVHEGGVLLVATSQGTVGRDVAALVGASLLNLVDAVIREQGSLPLNRRRGALVVVDEMQSMPGVDYESMLSELGKFGASFILATQSLAKLDDLSRTMRDTLLANVGCLAVFQVAGNDARTLVWELGKDRVTEDDITSLSVHHCYVRATVGIERMPAFSMMVRKPEDGDPAVAAYTVSARQTDYADADGHKKVGDYRKGVEDLEKARQEERAAEQDPKGGKQTGKCRAAEEKEAEE